MIGKIMKAASFSRCVHYVTGKEEAKILASDGVLLTTTQNCARNLRFVPLLIELAIIHGNSNLFTIINVSGGENMLNNEGKKNCIQRKYVYLQKKQARYE